MDIIHDEHYAPMKAKELAILLNVPKENREELVYVLNTLVAEGKIGVSKKGKYDKLSNKVMVGVFTGNARGFGFVTVEGEEEDIFIPESRTHGALHGDTVQIALRPARDGGGKEERERL